MGRSCVLSSVICRDFFRRIGFGDAKSRSVIFEARCYREGVLVRRAVAGHPDEAHRYVQTEGRWFGHMCVLIPSLGVLVDMALLPMIRPEWSSAVQRGVVLSLAKQPASSGHADFLAGISGPQADGSTIAVGWSSSNDTGWRGAPDLRRRRLLNEAVEYLVRMHEARTGVRRSKPRRS